MDSEKESKEKMLNQAKTAEDDDNAPTQKVGQGEYASANDSPKGNQLRNTDDVIGTA